MAAQEGLCLWLCLLAGPWLKLASPAARQGVPTHMGEADIVAYFSAKFAGVAASRVMRDRATGESRGFAFVVSSGMACVAPAA